MPTDRTAPSDPDRPTPTSSRSAVTSTVRVVRSVRRSRLERRTLFLSAGSVVGIWLLVVFANALADASGQAALMAHEEAVNASLQARADAGAAEIVTVAGSAFQEFIARSYRMGAPGERAFALAPGAPPPPEMVPLGQDPVTASTSTPLEDWLDLLVGS